MKINNIEIPKTVERIHEIFKKNGYKLFLVGGAVRDSLLGIRPKDFDLATDAIPDRVEEILNKEGFKTLGTGKSFGVINVFVGKNEYEIATFRSDNSSGRRPDSVTFTTIEEDVKRRDLTINALFFDLDKEEVVDLVGGLDDLKNEVVRTVGNPTDRFLEDKLRIMRTMRFAGRLGSMLTSDIVESIKNDNTPISGDGKRLSQERIQMEFISGIKQAKDVCYFLELLEKFSLMEWVFGDLSVDNRCVSSKNPVIVVSTLLINNSNFSKKLTQELKFKSKFSKEVGFLVKFFNKHSIETVYELKVEYEKLGMNQQTFLDFCKVMGVDKTFVKNFNKFELTVSGKKLVGMGLKGQEISNMKRKMETENFDFLMRKSTVAYTGVILNQKSMKDLIGLLNLSVTDLSGWVIHSHHMTICLGPSRETSIINREVELRVVSIGETDGVLAVGVESSILTKNEVPHITLATKEGVKPVDSNKITDWKPIKPFIVKGIIQEVLR